MNVGACTMLFFLSTAPELEACEKVENNSQDGVIGCAP